MAGMVVRPGARILHGHDWVYASEILKTFGNPEPGDIVSLKDGRDRLLGSAIYNPSSQIVARRISRRRQELDAGFFARRVGRAVAWRERSGCDLGLCRLIWSEADGLPGVVADRYGDVVVLQTLTLAMDRAKDLLAAELARLPGVAHVLERSDGPARAAEGLEPSCRVLVGDDPGTRVVGLAGARFEVDFRAGHKTGLYLDQAENYRLVAGYARGARVLDCFSNSGGFAMACAAAGAASVTAIESGATAAARLRANALLNGVSPVIHEEDVFSLLPELPEGSFDLVILDPPSFTHARARVKTALRGYRDLHRLAAPLLAADGLLATFCCSHHVPPHAFEESVAAGFFDARRSGHVLARPDQPPDHPSALHIPESTYLRGLILAARAAF
jgi:23S rRNA (cytosine1962-C5)-methyltransferase